MEMGVGRRWDMHEACMVGNLASIGDNIGSNIVGFGRIGVGVGNNYCMGLDCTGVGVV